MRTHIVLGLLARVPVEVDHLAVVPAPVALLDVGQVEACRTQPLLVARVNLYKNFIIFIFLKMFHVFYIFSKPFFMFSPWQCGSCWWLGPGSLSSSGWGSCHTLENTHYLEARKKQLTCIMSDMKGASYQMNMGVSLPRFSHWTT